MSTGDKAGGGAGGGGGLGGVRTLFLRFMGFFWETFFGCFLARHGEKRDKRLWGKSLDFMQFALFLFQ
jgi:hypothetical protein